MGKYSTVNDNNSLDNHLYLRMFCIIDTHIKLRQTSSIGVCIDLLNRGTWRYYSSGKPYGAKHSPRLGQNATFLNSDRRVTQESRSIGVCYSKVPRLSWFIQTPIGEVSLSFLCIRYERRFQIGWVVVMGKVQLQTKQFWKIRKIIMLWLCSITIWGCEPALRMRQTWFWNEFYLFLFEKTFFV